MKMQIEWRKLARIAFIKAAAAVGLILAFLSASQTAFAFTAETIGNYGDITAMAVDGNYDAKDPGGNINSAPREAIAKEFYKTHPDTYDFIYIFTNFDFQMPIHEAVAFYTEIRNDVSGIGQDQFDNSWMFGSNGRLQGTIDMGNLKNMASDPMDPNFSFTLGIMSHELMHRWGVHVKFKLPDGSISNALLGQENSHWSFLLDTKGSVMYGNAWQDNGNGTFTSLKGRKYYCPLDLYLMGLIDKSEVPPMLLIDSPGTDPTQVSKTGVTITGTPQYVTIDEIIAAEGERSPDYTTSQKDFRIGCILITRPGTFSGQELTPIRTLMSNWVVWHSGLTNGKSTIEFVKSPLEALPSNPGPSPPPYQPRPTPADVEDGVAWLIQHQQSDGSWADSDQTPEKDTAAALRALKPFSQAATSIDHALQWLGQNGLPASTDYLARIIEALVIEGAAVTDFLPELNQRQNSDGAWGPHPGFTSSPADTALALRALMAAGQSDAPLLSAAVEYLKSGQNPDGGWGSPQVSDIQTTTNVLLAFAPLRVSYGLNQSVQQGLDWLYTQQNADGGFGEGTSTVYDTAAALMALKTYDGLPGYYGPAIKYLQGMQSADGSWHASVFETAVAAEALNAWKDSVDADLAVISSDIQFYPDVIAHTPEPVTIDVTVHNNGLAGAEGFDVELYDNGISSATLLGRQSIGLNGLTGTTLSFPVTFNDTQDHRIFVVVDPGNQVIETNETNNTTFAVLTNTLNPDPDLQVQTDDMIFTPAAISQIPADVTLEAVVRNTGLSGVPTATVVLYQDAVTDTAKIGQQQVAVPAQSAVTLTFPFTVVDGETHRYYLIVDPAGQVAELDEYNNTAIKQLTSNPTYDFGLQNEDLALSTATVEMGQQVTISARIRNYGTRDGYHLPARFFVEKDGKEYDIATLTFDLPAGGYSDQQVVWTADQSGTDMRVLVQVDPFNAFSELSETNNAASTLLTVHPYPDPNLTLTYQDINISPSPALEGQSAVITATIRNDGGGPAKDVRVDFAWNKIGETSVPLGSRSIAELDAGQSADVSWTIDSVSVADQRQISVTIDPDNTIKEVSEEDNSAFNVLDVLSLPDFVIQSSSIGFNPSAPAEGNPVTVTIAVQNTGEQDGVNVPVVLMEGSQQLAGGIIARVPGNSQATIAFNYDTAGRSGVHQLTSIVDPDHTIVEKQTDNNSAERTLVVQNSDLWLSQSYISADGNPDQAGTTFFFRFDQATDVTVVVVDEYGEIVRTFGGGELTQTTGAGITWDGRNDRGVLVPDGDYQIQVRDLLGNVLKSMPVTVDNNLSSLAEAAGTDFLSIKNITCLLPQIEKWRWFSDESGIIFEIKDPDTDAPEYPPGIYSMSPSGGDIHLIVPPEWTAGNDPDYNYTFRDFALSPDGITIVVAVYKLEKNGQSGAYEIWTMDRYGKNRTLIDTLVNGDYIDAGNIQWSPDGSWFAYVVRNGDMATWGQGVRFSRPDGSEKRSLPFENARSIFELRWAPDSARLFYSKYDWDNRQEAIVVGDLSGQTRDIFQLPPDTDIFSPQWIDPTHFIFAYADDQQGKSVIIGADALAGQAMDLNVVPDERSVESLTAHPSGGGFVFASGPFQCADSDTAVQFCDMAGQCETIHSSRQIGDYEGLGDLAWSPRGDTLAVYDSFYEKLGDCRFAGHIVSMDWPQGETGSFPVTYPVQPPCGQGCITPYSFHIWSQKDGLWVEQGVLHYGADLETRSIRLPGLKVDAQGHAVLRITQTGTDAAHVDAVALTTDSASFVPTRAVVLSSGADILPQVRVIDGDTADVTGATVEYEWADLPSSVIFTLTMHANELIDPGSGQGDEDPEAAQGYVPPYEDMNFVSGSLRWFNDGVWLMGMDYDKGMFVLNAKNGRKAFFDLDWPAPALSPHGRYITAMLNVPQGSPCYGRGYTDLWVMQSLLNLTADLQIVRKESYLELRGTAADRNFAQFSLDYALMDSPDEWHPIRPPVETMVADGLLAQWVPPRPGVYVVRLTATDKVGHTAFDSRRVSWGLDSPIADLYLEDEYISPNGDGIQDALQLHYTVREPVNLEFHIVDKQCNQRVATIQRSYATLPVDDGKQVLAWDGRDDSGQIVPDGAYAVEVLGYEYDFVIDNTPPDVTFELSRVKGNEIGVKETSDGKTVELKALLTGLAVDENLKQWTIEHGDGDNPQTWYPLAKGANSLGKVENGQHEPGTLYVLGPQQLGLMAGHKFRLTVEDQAGNIHTVATERLEEVLVVYQWAPPDLEKAGLSDNLTWKDLDVRREDNGDFMAWGEVPSIYLDTKHHRILSLNTIRTPLDSMVLQYRLGFQWHDGPQIQAPSNGSMVYAFEGQLPDRESINAVRLKAVDKNSAVHFSNPAPAGPQFNFGCASRDNNITLSIYPFEELAYLAVKSEPEKAILKEWDNSNGNTVPLGSLPFDVDGSIPGEEKTLTLYAIGLSGREYTFSDKVKYCSDASGGNGGANEEIRGPHLTVTYPAPAACDTLASGIVGIRAFADSDSEKQATKLAYYIRQGGNSWQLLREFDLTKESWDGVEFDINAVKANGLFEYPEGPHALQAVVTEADGTQFTIDRMAESCETRNSDDQEMLPARVIVDRTLPQGQVTAPATGAVICPQPDGQKLIVPIQGTADDQLKLVSYALQYGYGDHVEDDGWIPARNANGDALKGSANVIDGLLGNWDVTGIPGGLVTLRLSLYDVAGNLRCEKYVLHLNESYQLTSTIDRQLFSPNGDGVQDQVKIGYSVNKAVPITVDVRQTDIVKTIAANVPQPAGNGELTWDGSSDDSQPVADGLYTIRVAATDTCGNVETAEIKDVEVDHTPPAVHIASPQPTDALGTIVEVRGTANDRNFLRYQLVLFDETHTEPLQVLKESQSIVQDGLLGTWNTYGVEGVRILKLTAWDKAGNMAEDTVRLDLQARKNLIVDYAVDPMLFSPNNDGKLETTQFNITLNPDLAENFNVTLELINASDAVVRTFAQSNLPGGAHNFVWDGRDASGQPVADGAYQAVLTAVLAEHSSVKQQEKVTVLVDATTPDVQISQPQPQAFVPAVLTIRGSINDANLESYSWTLNGTDGEKAGESGQVNRSDYTFATLSELADGPYTLSVLARDRGQTETRTTLSLIVDKTPPKPSLEGLVDGRVYGGRSPVIDILGSIEEQNIDQWQLRYRLQSADPNAWAILAQGDTLPAEGISHSWAVGPADGIADGNYIVSLYALDKAGWKTETAAGVAVDNMAPTTAITQPAEAGYVTVPAAILGTAADANLSTYKVEAAEGDCSQAFKWTPIKQASASVTEGELARWQLLPPDGGYCLRVSAEDAAGLTSQKVVHVTVDTHPPAAPVLSGKIENKTSAHLTWTANSEPDLTGYNLYRNDKKLNTALLSATEYSDADLQEGPYHYTVRAVDQAGWESDPSNAVELQVDLKPPLAHIMTPGDGAVVSDLVEIKGTAYSTDDFKEYRLYVGQGPDPANWQLLNRSALSTSYGVLGQWDTIALTSGAQYSLKLEAEDLSGNVGEDRVVVTIDNKAPAPPVLLSAAAQGLLSSNVDVVWQANTEPDLAGYLLYRNDQLVTAEGQAIGDLTPYLLTATAYTDGSLADGTYEYYLLAMDKAGNLSAPSNRLSVTIDLQAPRAAIIQPESGHTFDQPLMIQAVCQDQDIAGVQFQYKAQSAAEWIDLNAAVTHSPFIAYLDPTDLNLSYGSYDLRAVATDQSGRTDSAPPAITVAYNDVTAPRAPVDLQAQVNGGAVTLKWTADSEPDLAGYNIYEVKDSGLTRLNTGLVPQATFVVGQTQELADGEYRFQVTAADSNGNESAGSGIVPAIVYAPSVEQPLTPTDQAQYSLYGSARPADSVEVFNDTGSGPQLLGTTAADDQGRFLFDLAFGLGENRLTVRASDGHGNISKSSPQVVVVYGRPPATPTGLVGDVAGHDVVLNWDPNTESDLAGYNVYRDGSKQNTDPVVDGGTTSASTYSSNAQYAVDNSPETYWRGYVSAGSTVWWQYDIGRQVLISRVSLDWATQANVPDSYELQAWSGYAWIPVVSVMGNTQTSNRFDILPAYPTDKIRLVVSRGSADPDLGWIMLSEFRMSRLDPVPTATFLDQNVADGQHGYYLEAVNSLGLVSPPSQSISLAVGDVVAPDAPVLTAAADGSAVTLNWTPPDAPDLAGYFVYKQVGQDWQRLTETATTSLTYVDAGLPNGTYTYRVTAVDTVGNESSPSNQASATVAVAAPDQPTDASATALPQGGRIQVCWAAVSGAAGYHVYRSTSPGGPYTLVGEASSGDTCYLDDGLVDGTSYYYIVRAIDQLGNESADSLEADAVAADLIAPQAPVLFAPTMAGVPVTVEVPKTDISGWAEPGSLVTLFKGGASLGSVQAALKDSLVSYALGAPAGQSVWSWTLSPDGRRAGFGMYDDQARDFVYHILDLEQGTQITISGDISAPRWSPDGKKLAYEIGTGNGERIIIYDMQSRSSTQLSNAEGLYDEVSPSWSPDGRSLLYIGNQIDGSYRVCVYHLDTGHIDSLLVVPNGSYPRVSPDGHYISFMNMEWSAGAHYQLYVYDTQTAAEPVLLTDALWLDDQGKPCVAWSPDDSYLGYVAGGDAGGDVYAWKPQDQTTTALTSYSDVRHFTWLPGARHVAYVRSTNDALAIWIAALDGSEPRRLTGMPVDWDLNRLVATSAGQLGYLSGQEVQLVDPAGRFRFGETPLAVGDNIFSATAADAAGNIGPASEPIRITLDGQQLPDLEVTTADLFNSPYVPLVGDHVHFAAVVRNAGSSDARNVMVDGFIQDAAGRTEQLDSTTIDLLPTGQETTVSFEWDGSPTAGRSSLIVTVDTQDSVFESDEANNLAMLDFFVAAAEGLHMETQTQSDRYEALQDVQIDIAFYNSLQARDVTLTVDIEDADRQPVARVGEQTFQLPYTPLMSRNLVWNTGRTLAGNYYVHSMLTDGSGFLAENLVSFAIDADTHITTQVLTDRLDYPANQTVQIHGSVAGGSQNQILSDLSARIIIRNSADEIVFETGQTIDYLYGTTAASVDAEWNTGSYPPGAYSVTLEVAQGGGTSAQSTRIFTIDTGQTITGSLDVQPAVTPAGGTVTVQYHLNLIGNSPIAGMPVEITLVDPDTLADLGSNTISVDLAVGGTVAGNVVFDTQLLSAKTYLVQLRCEQKVLAQGALTIQSADQPPVELSGTLSADPQNLRTGQELSLNYTITNAGALDLQEVRLQVMVPEGVGGSFERSLSLPVGTTISGRFTMPTDSLVPDTYTSRLMVKLNGMPAAVQLAAADFSVTPPEPKTHPPVAMAGGPYIAAVGETIHVDGSASFDPDEGRSESGQPPFDTIIEYAWETSLVEPLAFDDALGVTAELPGFDTAGTHEIALRVTDNTQAAFPAEGQANMTGTGTAEVDVYPRSSGCLFALPGATRCLLVWAPTGAEEYEILRSETGPSSGFESIATTRILSIYLDDKIEADKDYWYRVRSHSCGGTRISKAVHVYTRRYCLD